MKKTFSILILFCLILSFAACGTGKQWTREGYFADEDGNLVSITWMDYDGSTGWYVSYMVGSDSYGNFLPQEGSSLKGNIVPEYEEGSLIVTVSEEGDGIRVDTEDGGTYHLIPYEMPQAALSVTLNTRGVGQIAYAETEDGIDFDEGFYTNSVVNLAGPEIRVFGARADEGWFFVKWMKDGEDYSNDAIITVELTEDADFTAVFESDDDDIDYLALVNKLNPLPEDWEENLRTVKITNSLGDTVEVEVRAYKAYQELRADLKENDGIYVELDSARRSVAAQQSIMDSFIEKYGLDYALKTVAQPGYSEHHTGLALDLYFRLQNEDGSFTDVYYNEDMVQYPGIWEKIHAKLADYGFILRYLEGREHITGYGYEPWHIRYVDDRAIATEIMTEDITFEEYLEDYRAPEVQIDYGTSSLYTREDMDAAVIQIKCRFASFASELHSLTYAGDSANNQENLDWLNSVNEGAGYIQVMEFLSSFRADESEVLERGKEYTDYQWWLARTEDGGWEVVTYGYGS